MSGRVGNRETVYDWAAPKARGTQMSLKPPSRLCFIPEHLVLLGLGVVSVCGATEPGRLELTESATDRSFAGRPCPPEARASAQTYRVDQTASQLVIKVYRGGALSRFGHNHIVSTNDVRGEIFLADDLAGSCALLKVPAESLAVDEPHLRAAAGERFESAPSARAIKKTRRNMLGERVLNAEQYPSVDIAITAAGGELPRPRLATTITIRDVTHTIDTRASVTIEHDQMTITGMLQIRQSDFGIEPYSALGGALQVQNRVDLGYQISATRLGSNAMPAQSVHESDDQQQ